MRRWPFRFGAVDLPAMDWSEQARRLEDLGFDVLLMPDRPQLPSALPALAAAAAVTTRLRSRRWGKTSWAMGISLVLSSTRTCRSVSPVAWVETESRCGAGWVSVTAPRTTLPSKATGSRSHRGRVWCTHAASAASKCAAERRGSRRR